MKVQSVKYKLVEVQIIQVCLSYIKNIICFSYMKNFVGGICDDSMCMMSISKTH